MGTILTSLGVDVCIFHVRGAGALPSMFNFSVVAQSQPFDLLVFLFWSISSPKR